jgi:hypothetical protein
MDQLIAEFMRIAVDNRTQIERNIGVSTRALDRQNEIIASINQSAAAITPSVRDALLIAEAIHRAEEMYATELSAVEPASTERAQRYQQHVIRINNLLEEEQGRNLEIQAGFTRYAGRRLRRDINAVMMNQPDDASAVLAATASPVRTTLREFIPNYQADLAADERRWGIEYATTTHEAGEDLRGPLSAIAPVRMSASATTDRTNLSEFVQDMQSETIQAETRDQERSETARLAAEQHAKETKENSVAREEAREEARTAAGGASASTAVRVAALPVPGPLYWPDAIAASSASSASSAALYDSVFTLDMIATPEFANRNLPTNQTLLNRYIETNREVRDVPNKELLMVLDRMVMSKIPIVTAWSQVLQDSIARLISGNRLPNRKSNTTTIHINNLGMALAKSTIFIERLQRYYTAVSRRVSKSSKMNAEWLILNIQLVNMLLVLVNRIKAVIGDDMVTTPNTKKIDDALLTKLFNGRADTVVPLMSAIVTVIQLSDTLNLAMNPFQACNAYAESLNFSQVEISRFNSVHKNDSELMSFLYYLISACIIDFDDNPAQFNE